ncbi:hypothetical protein D3C81_1020090 [compost metagenome]
MPSHRFDIITELPRQSGQLSLQRFGCVLLQNNMVLELILSASADEGLKCPGVAEAAPMGASPVRIDRPVEGHPFFLHSVKCLLGINMLISGLRHDTSTLPRG